MADADVVIDEPVGDEEMGDATGLEPTEAVEADDEPTGLEDIEPDVPERTTFLE